MGYLIVKKVFFIILTMLMPLGTQKTMANCVEVYVGSQKVLLPHGMNKQVFSELVEIFRQHRIFDDFRAMILYGSRMHHTVGYDYLPSSDIDVAFLPMKPIDIMNRINVMEESRNIFMPLAKKMELRIEEEIPIFDYEAEILSGKSKSRFTSHSREAEKNIWNHVSREAEKNQWNREEIKRELITSVGGFTKESLILVRGKDAEPFLRYLREREYTNVFIVD